MITLDALPEDIILDIASKLHAKDNMRLRLVCRVLGRIVARFALADLVISLDMKNYSARATKLRAYSRKATVGTEWARTLTISSSGNIHDHERWNSTVLDARTGQDLDQDFKEDLSATLSELNLHTLRWHTYFLDPEWAFEVFPRYLATHPVRNLTLDLARGFSRFSTTSFVLDDISHLQQLTVHNICSIESDRRTDDLIIGIAKIIRHSPSLTNLAISSGCWSTSHIPQMPTVHQFLVDNPALELKTLSLNALRITMDDITTPYFRSLHSLTIRHDCINPTLERRAEIKEVWKTLHQEQIKLRKIQTDVNLISDELLKYLEYCRGTLQDLVFCESEDTEPETQAQVDNAAVSFYRQILPQLANHLEHLQIETRRVNRWCFSTDSARAIGECRKLKTLGVSIVDFHQSHSKHVRELLQETIDKLPAYLELETFNVSQVPQIG